MKRLAIPLLLAVSVLTACGHSDDLKLYVPMDNSPRPERKAMDVVLLDEAPTDRPFKVIGLIAPPEGSFDSYAETINAVRQIAADHGADAIFLTDESHRQGWSFSGGPGGASGGSSDHVLIQAKAIVWTTTNVFTH